MFSPSEFTESLFTHNAKFEDLAFSLFHFQYEHNALYREYLKTLGKRPDAVHGLREIPFLPILFFKTHEVKTGNYKPALIFESSGTTQTTPGRSLVKTPKLYKKSFRSAFSLFYGDIRDYTILGLLPSYLERQNSSLVYMVNDWIRKSDKPESGFYLDEHEKLAHTLQKLEVKAQKTLLIGVTFGLLDFVEKYPMHLSHTLIMETGGMKGRREEWTREEVHDFLRKRLNVEEIHSEYGMTELMSQAYSKEKGLFHCPPWMRIMLRDINDPLQILPPPETGQTSEGVINIIDLANIDTCAFIATDDLGRLHPDGSFEVLGRRDNSDLRGCSLMIQQ